MKCCPRCGETKDASAFNKNRRLRDGLACYCRSCAAEYMKAWWDARPPPPPKPPLEPRRCAYCRGEFVPKVKQNARYCSNKCAASSHNRSKANGLTDEEWWAMADASGGKCAICGVRPAGDKIRTRKKWTLVLDHDHETGQLREFLCSNHNTGLGMFSDDPELLRKAALYLERHRQGRLKLIVTDDEEV